MFFHGVFHVFFRAARLQAQSGVQGIEFEKVTVRLAGWRARAAISEVFEIVEPLGSAAGDMLAFR